IPSNRPLTVPFKASNIVILSGQNGYGKTTLFDAVELLFCGDIKHFYDNLLNRGYRYFGYYRHA
ncbi:MAG: ATP-binding protein, partial [Eubacteriaceae bacterium]